MSRDGGFLRADLDVGILDDPKFRAIARSTRDAGTTARCVTGYLAVLTASWARGERLTLTDAAPLWLDALDDLGERLTAVGLLDSESRIPEKAWAAWYLPARARRDAWSEAGRRGGLKAHGVDPDAPRPPSIQPSVHPTNQPYGLRRAQATLEAGSNEPRERRPTAIGDVLREVSRICDEDAHDLEDVVLDAIGRSGQRCLRCGLVKVKAAS